MMKVFASQGSRRERDVNTCVSSVSVTWNCTYLYGSAHQRVARSRSSRPRRPRLASFPSTLHLGRTPPRWALCFMDTVGETDLRAAAAALRRLEAEDGADGSQPGSPVGGRGGLDDESDEDAGGTPLALPPAAPPVAPAPPLFLLGGAAAAGGAPAAPASATAAADALFGASVDALLAEAPRGRGGRRSSKRPRGGGSGGGSGKGGGGGAGGAGEDGRKRRTDLPRHLQPLMGAATLAYLHGRLPDAVATLRRVITEAPKAPAPYRTLALIARERGDAARALNLSLLAAHLSPREVGVWKDLARDSVAAGRVDQAVYCLGMALKASNGRDVGALSARADLYARVGNAKRAAEAYARLAAAVAVHPAVAVRLAALASSYSNGYRAVAGVSGVLRRLETGGVLGEPFGLWQPPPAPAAAPPPLPADAAAATDGDADGVAAAAPAAAAAGDDRRSREVWRWKLIRILARLLARTRQWAAAAALLSRVGMQVGAGEISTATDEEGVRAVAVAVAAAAAAAAAAPPGANGVPTPPPPSAGSTATAGGASVPAPSAGGGDAGIPAAGGGGTSAVVESAAGSAGASARGAAVGGTAPLPPTPAVPPARPVMALDLRVRLATCHVRLHSPALATRAVSELLAHPAPAASHTEVVWDLAEAYRSVGDMDQALFFYGLLDALPDFEYASTLHFHMSRCRRLALGRDTDLGGGRAGAASAGHVVTAGASPAGAAAGAVADDLGLRDVPFALPAAPSNRPLPTPAAAAAVAAAVAAAAAVVGGPDGRGTKRPQPGADGAAADSAAAAAGAPAGPTSVTADAAPGATEGSGPAPPAASLDTQAAQANALAALRAAEAAATADDEAGPPGGPPPLGLFANNVGPAADAPPRAPGGLPTLFDTPLATDGSLMLPPGSGVSMPYRRPRKPYTPAGRDSGGSGGGGGAPPPGVELSLSFRQRGMGAAGLPSRPATGDAAGGGGPSWAPSYNSRSVTAAGAAAAVREVLAAADGWYEAGLPARYLAAVAPLVELTAGVGRGFLPRHALRGALGDRTGATHDEEVDAALRAAVASYAAIPPAEAATTGAGAQGTAASAGASVLATGAVEACVPMEGVVVAGRPALGSGDGAPPAAAASDVVTVVPAGAAAATPGDPQTPPAAAGGTPAAAPVAASAHPDRWSWRTLWWRNGRRAFGVAHVSRAVTTVLEEAAFVRLTERLLAAAAAVGILPAAAAVARKLASQRRFHGRTRAARMRLLAAVAAVVLHRPAVAATELRGLIGERPHAAGLWRVFLDAEALASGKDVLDQPVTRFMTRLVSKEPAATPLGLLMGHESAAAGSHGYALAHYASVARAAPRCALVALCMGVQYLQAALSRRTRNRNDQVLRAFVHLNCYRKLRVEGAGGHETGGGGGGDDAPAAAARPAAPVGLRAAVVAAEADYNVGRGFHMMGLLHLAVPLYRRVLAAPLPPSVTGADGGGGGGPPPQAWLDVRRDAAFNLAAIYTAVPGNEAVAVAETREVLTF